MLKLIPAAPAPDYLNPNLKAGLSTVRIPVVQATADSLQGCGLLVDDPQQHQVEIVRWPSQGWRPVDVDSGNEGGTTVGTTPTAGRCSFPTSPALSWFPWPCRAMTSGHRTSNASGSRAARAC